MSFILQQHRASAVRILKREVGGCMCSDFTWFREIVPRSKSNEDGSETFTRQGRPNIKGSFLGGCRTRNEDKDEFCYVHQPNNCTDARASKNFVGMDVSATACNCKFNRFGQCSKVIRNKRLAASHENTEDGNTKEIHEEYDDDAQLIPNDWM